MAVALVQGISNLSSTAGTTATATLPAAATAGNVLVAFIHTGSKSTGGAPTGWTQPAGGNANVNGRSSTIAYKVAAGGETGFSAAITSGVWEVHLLEYSGVDTTTPVQVAAASTGGVTTTAVTTTAGSNVHVVCSGGATTGPSATAWSGPTIGGAAATFVTVAPSTRLSSGSAGTAYGASYHLGVASAPTSISGTVTGVGSNISSGIVVLNVAAVTGTAYTYTVDDSAGLTGGQTLEVGRGVTDAAGSVDAAATAGVWLRQADDDAGLTGGQTLAVARTVTDAAGLADTAASSLTTGANYTVTVTDAAGVADAPALAVARAVTDAAGAVDGTALAVARQVTDPAGTTDSPSRTGAWSRTVTDSAGLTDTAGTGTTTAAGPGLRLRGGSAMRLRGNAPLRGGGAAGAALTVTVTDLAGSTDTQAVTNRPPVRVLFDAFATQDDAKWTYSAGAASVVAGQVQVVPTNGYLSAASVATYSLWAGGAVTAEAVQVPNLGNGSTEMLLSLADLTTTSSVELMWSAGTLYARDRVNGGAYNIRASATYSVAAMRWWRVSHDGTNTVWEYSGDRVTWSQLASTPVGVNLAAVTVLLQAGYWGTETAPGIAIFDNVNVVASSLTDSAGVADAATPTLTVGGAALAYAVTDAAGTTDAQALAVARGLTDAAGSADATALAVNRAITDPGGTVDGTALAVARQVADAAGVTDLVAASTSGKASSLTDAFATADPAKWSGIDGTNVLVTGGRLQVNATPSYFSAYSVHAYDLTGSQVSVEVPQVPNLGNGSTSAYLTAYDVVTGNSVDLLWQGGTLYTSYTAGGVTSQTEIVFSPTAHRFWRIREAAGTLYWEATATGASWSQLRAVPTPWTMTAVTIFLKSGYWGTEPAPGFALFDNVNLPPTPATPGAARTFYVDPAGSDTADGLTAGTAWATLAKVSAAPLFPGDSVLLKRASVWTGGVTISDSGASGAPITLGAYGTGFLPVIDGGGASGVAGTSRTGELYGSWVVADSVEFRGSGDIGVLVFGTDCTVQGCAVRWGSYGVQQLPQAARAKILYNTMTDVNVGIIRPGTNDDGGGSGVLLEGDAAEVAFNVVTGCVFVSPDYGLDGQSIEVYGATNATIHHNRSIDSVAFTELGNPASSGNVYYDNVATSTLAVGGGFTVHGTYYDDGTTPDPFGPVTGTRAWHNTVVLTGGDAASTGVWVSPGGEIDWRNNVVVVAGSAKAASIGATSRTVTEAGNVYWNTGGAGSTVVGLPAAMSGTSTIADPLFVGGGDYRLRKGSPAIDRGATLAAVTTDYAGNPRTLGTAPDSGAYEGAVIVVAVTDSAGPADTQALMVGRQVADSGGPVDAAALATTRAVTDPGGAVDSLALAAGRQATDSAGMVDGQVLAAGKAITVDDPAGAVDGQILAASHASTVDDPAGMVDGQTLGVARTATDTAGSTDTAAPASDWRRAVDDPAGAVDSTALTLERAQTDPAGSTDTASRVALVSLAVTDTAGPTDSAALFGAWVRVLTDDAGLTDAATTLGVPVGPAMRLRGGSGMRLRGNRPLRAGGASGFSAVVDDSAGSTDALAVAALSAQVVSDSAATSDLGMVTVGRQVTDPAGTVDAAGTVAVTVRAVTDDAGSTDTVVPAKSGSATYTVTDPAGAADSAQLLGQWLRQVDDPAGAVDAASPGMVYARQADDPAGAADSASLTVARQVTDDTGERDAAATAAASVQSVTDPAGVVDAAASGIGRVVDDPAGAVDTASPLRFALITVTDTAAATDTATPSQGFGVAVTDDTGQRDSTSTAAAYAQAFTDPAGAGDGQALTVARQADDNAGASDSASSLRFALIAVTDVAGSTDTTAQAQTFGAVVADDTGTSDLASTTAAWARSLTDSAGLADAAAVGILGVQWTVAVTDTGGPTDAATIARGYAAAVTDDAGQRDTLTILGVWLRTAADDAGLTDALTLEVGLPVTDPAGLTDGVTLTTFTGKQITYRDDLGRTPRVANGATARVSTGRTSGL